VADASQLTLAELQVAQAQVPVATWAALTPAQRGFVAAIVREPTITLTRAAEIATGTKKRAKQNGSQWSRDPRVKAALDHLRAVTQEAAEDDLAFVTRRLKQNDAAAFQAADIAASNAALGLFAKVRGLLEKRVRLTLDNPDAILAQLKAMPKAERVKVLRELFGEAS
jgi:hypothetical protein